MITQPIVFLGAGNMARALVASLRQQGIPGGQIQVHAPHAARRDALQAEFGIRSCPATPAALPPGAIVLYAAKPAQAGDILRAWRTALADAGGLLISVAAGIRLQTLRDLVGSGPDIVRAMPNTPVQVGAGATTLCAPPDLGPERRQQAEAILGATGLVLWLGNEDTMDAATALAGSGPAYVLLLLEALEDAAVCAGLAREPARQLALQTILGTARMAAASSLSPGTLRHQVTSPGGTTAAALAVWEEGLRPLAHRAIQAAIRRSQELAGAAAGELLP